MQENLKTKTKSHGDVTGFYNKEIHNVDSNHNKLGFHSQKRWELFAKRVFKSVNTLSKK